MAAESRHKKALCTHMANFNPAPSFCFVCTAHRHPDNQPQGNTGTHARINTRADTLRGVRAVPFCTLQQHGRGRQSTHSDLAHLGRTHPPPQAKDHAEVADLPAGSQHARGQRRRVNHAETQADAGGNNAARKAGRRGTGTSAYMTCRKSDIGVTPGCQLKSAGRIIISPSHPMPADRTLCGDCLPLVCHLEGRGARMVRGRHAAPVGAGGSRARPASRWISAADDPP